MEARVTKLEAQIGDVSRSVSDIKTDVAVVKATMATKVDLNGLGDKVTGKLQIYLGLVATLIVIATAVQHFW